DLVDSEKYFTTAMKLDPTYASPFASSAVVLSWMIDYGYRTQPAVAKQALNLAHHASSLDPNLADAHLAAATILSRTSDFDSTFRELKDAVRLDPNNEMIHLYLGVFFQNSGDWDQSLRECTIIKRLHPSATYVISQPALFHIYRGEYKEAQAGFN